MKILVTGSSGMIGTRLCERLLENGADLICLDKKPNEWNDQINERTILVDLCDVARTEELLPKDIDVIVHLAANARVYDLVKDPSLAQENVTSTFTVLEFARKHNISRLVLSSSREIYGESARETYAETDTQINDCQNTYAASKIANEVFVRAYAHCHDLEFLMFRFANVYGMYDTSDRVIPKFIRQLRAGEDITIYGEGKVLDLIFIDDVVTVLMQGIAQFDARKNQTYNLASGIPTTLETLATELQTILASSSNVTHAENRVGEVTKFVANTQSLHESFSLTPTPLQEGLRKTVAWQKSVFT